jgi:hypothetical protein
MEHPVVETAALYQNGSQWLCSMGRKLVGPGAFDDMTWPEMVTAMGHSRLANGRRKGRELRFPAVS